jgi:two-component system phosphate regulon response regulator OmpR
MDFKIQLGIAKSVKPNVLIVDDDSIVHLLYGRYLAEAGYEVLSARNGQEAVAIVSRETVQLIVMDIMMPGSDGLSVLRELKSSVVGRNVPVIVMSANVENYRTATRMSLNSGAASFLPKPLRPARLRAEVNRFVPLPPQPTRSPTPGARQ